MIESIDADKTLYHYCSSATAALILTRKRIWLSSLSLSNDSLEGRLVRETLIRLSTKDGLDASYRERLVESLGFAERTFEGLGFCLSEMGDLLSQWRGYADDAQGIAIGFSSEYLTKLSQTLKGAGQPNFTLYQIEYGKDRQDAAIEPAYRKMKGLIDAGAFRGMGLSSLLDSRTPDQIAADDEQTRALFSTLVFELIALFPKFYELKGEGFREECEWRLVSILLNTVDDNFLFRGVSNRIVPYREFELIDLGIPPIREIVVGPRHSTPTHILQMILRQSGLADVHIRNSEVSYR